MTCMRQIMTLADGTEVFSETHYMGCKHQVGQESVWAHQVTSTRTEPIP